MNHLIVLWIMIAPGVWDKQELTFDTYKECHAVTHALMDRSIPPNPKKLEATIMKEWYNDSPPDGIGIMFVDKCR